jgi:phosphoribosylanthranilate isomerase
VERPVIKVFHLGTGFSSSTIIDDLTYGNRILGDQKHMFLLDTSVVERFGGTGVKFNWKRAQQITRKFPVIVAGGLNPGNVAEAINILHPWGVDVSSGVETKGVKDMKKVVKFIEAIRNADASQT